MSTREQHVTVTTSAASPTHPLTESVLRRRFSLARLTLGGRAIVPYLNFAAQRIGRLGIIGIALCVFAAVAWVSTSVPLREQIATDTLALETLGSGPDVAVALAASAAAPEAGLESFLGDLPSREDLPALMGQIVAVSTETGVSLEEGNYELATVGRSGLIDRYELKFPVSGTYPQVRSFIDQALVAVPAMSLDGLSLERDVIGERLVTAELDFAVFVRTR